jgi:putative tryptophan/tyrosine transport system substrate-binding protein
MKRRDAMRRREFIAGLGGATLWSLSAHPQQAAKIPVVGVLWHGGSAEEEEPFFGGLIDSFKRLGYIDGKTIRLVHRFPNEVPARFRAMAAELVTLNVNVLITVGAATANYAKEATATIPVIFAFVPDPVWSRLVESLARPGGNITGVSNYQGDLNGKRIELLKEILPSISKLGLLINANEPASRAHLAASTETARKLGLTLHTAEARSPDELDRAFDALRNAGVQAVNIGSGPSFFAWRAIITTLAIARRLPIGAWSRAMLDAGAMMSYGSDQLETIRRTAVYVDKVLKGAKPSELPVEQPTKYQLGFNLKTARALGLTVPPTLLGRADEVIE